MSDTKEARTETNVVIQAVDREEEVHTDLQSETPYKTFVYDVRIGDFENCANESIGQNGTFSSDESGGSAAARAEISHDEYILIHHMMLTIWRSIVRSQKVIRVRKVKK